MYSAESYQAVCVPIKTYFYRCTAHWKIAKTKVNFALLRIHIMNLSVCEPPFCSSDLPSIASTVLSFRTSMDPEQTKYMACRASPCRMRNSPGAQKEVLIMRDRERRQPLLADSNRGSWSSSLFRCMAMSALSSSGKSFSSCKVREG